MNNVLEFITNNYLFFVIVSVFLILALIGYFADKFTNKDIKINDASSDKMVESL